MNHWPFIIAAYVITIVGGAGVTLWAFLAMRRAEQDADAIGRRE